MASLSSKSRYREFRRHGPDHTKSEVLANERPKRDPAQRRHYIRQYRRWLWPYRAMLALVFGLTEFIKSLAGWEGKKVTMLAAALWAIVMVLYQLIGIVPEPYRQILQIVFASAAFGLSASGYYKFIDKRLPEK